MPQILLVGAGRMGGAMLRGWARSFPDDNRIVVLDPNLPAEVPGKSATCISHAADMPDGFRPDAVVLATKPQFVTEAVQSVAAVLNSDAVVISVAAGVSAATIGALCQGSNGVIRVMPNIGAMVGHSVTAGFASDGTSSAQRDLAHRLFAAIGTMTWLETEDQLHMVTALSGSGPAYYFAFCEAMIAAAKSQGLPENLARELAIRTMTCSGSLLAETPDPKSLREAVTSPKGTTEAGLASLTEGGLFGNLADAALRAATRRSRELSRLLQLAE